MSTAPLTALETRFGRVRHNFTPVAAPVVRPAPVIAPQPNRERAVCCRWNVTRHGVCSECLAARGGK